MSRRGDAAVRNGASQRRDSGPGARRVWLGGVQRCGASRHGRTVTTDQPRWRERRARWGRNSDRWTPLQHL
jgi:hypothetical protein